MTQAKLDKENLKKEVLALTYWAIAGEILNIIAKEASKITNE